jgi:hypothetical protein
MTRRSPHIGFALVGPVIGFGWLVAVAGGGRPIGAAIGRALELVRGDAYVMFIGAAAAAIVVLALILYLLR